MTANDSKFYLPYLNKFVDQYNNTYHHSINKKPINYSALTQKIEMNHETSIFKVNDRVRITKYIFSHKNINHKNIFNKGCTKNWSREIFIIDFVLRQIKSKI